MQRRHFTRLAGIVLAAAMMVMLSAVSATTYAKTKLTMYYPVAVGGPLTKIVDGMVADLREWSTGKFCGGYGSKGRWK